MSFSETRSLPIDALDSRMSLSLLDVARHPAILVYVLPRWHGSAWLNAKDDKATHGKNVVVSQRLRFPVRKGYY
jgi:hypothetical protein